MAEKEDTIWMEAYVAQKPLYLSALLPLHLCDLHMLRTLA